MIFLVPSFNNIYNFCFNSSQLNGKYYTESSKIHSDGVMWIGFRGNNYSLKYAHMAIRPVHSG